MHAVSSLGLPPATSTGPTPAINMPCTPHCPVQPVHIAPRPQHSSKLSGQASSETSKQRQAATQLPAPKPALAPGTISCGQLPRSTCKHLHARHCWWRASPLTHGIPLCKQASKREAHKRPITKSGPHRPQGAAAAQAEPWYPSWNHQAPPTRATACLTSALTEHRPAGELTRATSQPASQPASQHAGLPLHNSARCLATQRPL
jgi:hypothetical protein